MTDMTQIEKLTRHYADRRGALAAEVQEVEDQVEKIKRRHLPRIKQLVNRTAEAHDRLAAAIEESPELFEKRRTLVIAGVRVGFTKGKGKIEWDSEDRVVERIHRHFPDRVEDLIKVTEKPVRAALQQLSTQELRKLGCEITDTGDYVVIKPTDGSVDKLVDALLKDAERLQEDAA